MTQATSDRKKVRCSGGYKSFGAPLVGLMKPHTTCPSCGGVIAFHWSMGKFRVHDRPLGEESDG